MEKIFIALLIGIAAGIADVVPMIIMKLDKKANWSAFIHWVFLGLIIPFVSWDIPAWLKGILIAELSIIPILIIITGTDKKSMIPVIALSAIIGAGVGYAGSVFIAIP